MAADGRVVARTKDDAARWVETLEEVSAFKARYGKLPGSKAVHSPRETQLRYWIKRQKAKEERGELSDLQVRALDLVDGDWRADLSRLSWEDKLAAAILEYQELGRVPGNSEGTGVWLRQQRSRMSAGKLDADQLQALDTNIPGWRNLDRITWFGRAGELRQYVERTGRLPTSRSRDPEGARVWTWLSFQRGRLAKGRLSRDQIDELNRILPGWGGRNHPNP